jgi:hypothetical protein
VFCEAQISRIGERESRAERENFVCGCGVSGVMIPMGLSVWFEVHYKVSVRVPSMQI